MMEGTASPREIQRCYVLWQRVEIVVRVRTMMDTKSLPSLLFNHTQVEMKLRHSNDLYAVQRTLWSATSLYHMIICWDNQFFMCLTCNLIKSHIIPQRLVSWTTRLHNLLNLTFICYNTPKGSYVCYMLKLLIVQNKGWWFNRTNYHGFTNILKGALHRISASTCFIQHASGQCSLFMWACITVRQRSR